ncbi:hypothetical protein GGS20DRAFT_110557 [Poronia punctata]|nr:hypothetical protein GGS20DRAFT_110557 [Poronia punctata]
MEQVGNTPINQGSSPYRYPYNDDGAARTVERMSSIQEATEYSNSRSGLASRSTKSTLLWPFHNRNTSEVPSTPRSSRLGRFRSGTWNSRSMLRSFDDSASIVDHSIVPDYVINFMRGETPESLARKKEAKRWVERNVVLNQRRDTLSSHLVEMGNYFGSTTDLTGGVGREGQKGGRMTGWRGGVFYNALLAMLVFVVVVVCLIIVVTRTKAFLGELVVFSGDCVAANRIDTGLHVIVNVFAAVLLAGANYVFQILLSPTREEVSEAHDHKRWLDIGIPSIRNLAHVSGFRAAMGIITLVVAIAGQVIYNAIISTTQGTSTKCAVNVNTSMLVVAAIIPLILILNMVLLLTKSTLDPLATLGDAIASFLQTPDPTTTSDSLLTKTDIQQGRWGVQGATKQCNPGSHYWLQAPSLSRWALTILSWVFVAAPTAAALALMARASSSGVNGPLGTATSETTFSFPGKTAIGMPQLALICALPQLLLSILYLSTNALLTTYFFSHELSLFALGPRPLRISSPTPVGAQTSSLYLSLPRPASWLLLLIFAALGFVLSQAVFPSSSTTTTSGIAFDPLGLLILFALLATVLFGILALGFRRTATRDGNPLAQLTSPCSAVLSARCHPASGEGEIWLGLVSWGVVEEGDGRRPGRCAFTGREGVWDAGMCYS